MDEDRDLLCWEHLLVYCWHLFQLQSLQIENTSLRRQVTTNIYQIPSGSDLPDPSSPSALKRRQSARASRPMSMYETGSGLKPFLPKGEPTYSEEGIPTLQPFLPHVSKTCSLLSFAISSKLPLFHNFPSCFHSVCQDFLSLLRFSLLICGSFLARDSHQKAQCHTFIHASHFAHSCKRLSSPYVWFTGVFLGC